jgi:hypothetical protein
MCALAAPSNPLESTPQAPPLLLSSTVLAPSGGAGGRALLYDGPDPSGFCPGPGPGDADAGAGSAAAAALLDMPMSPELLAAAAGGPLSPIEMAVLQERLAATAAIAREGGGLGLGLGSFGGFEHAFAGGGGGGVDLTGMLPLRLGARAGAHYSAAAQHAGAFRPLVPTWADALGTSPQPPVGAPLTGLHSQPPGSRAGGGSRAAGSPGGQALGSGGGGSGYLVGGGQLSEGAYTSSDGALAPAPHVRGASEGTTSHALLPPPTPGGGAGLGRAPPGTCTPLAPSPPPPPPPQAAAAASPARPASGFWGDADPGPGYELVIRSAPPAAGSGGGGGRGAGCLGGYAPLSPPPLRAAGGPAAAAHHANLSSAFAADMAMLTSLGTRGAPLGVRLSGGPPLALPLGVPQPPLAQLARSGSGAFSYGAASSAGSGGAPPLVAAPFGPGHAPSAGGPPFFLSSSPLPAPAPVFSLFHPPPQPLPSFGTPRPPMLGEQLGSLLSSRTGAGGPGGSIRVVQSAGAARVLAAPPVVASEGGTLPGFEATELCELLRRSEQALSAGGPAADAAACAGGLQETMGGAPTGAVPPLAGAPVGAAPPEPRPPTPAPGGGCGSGYGAGGQQVAGGGAACQQTRALPQISPFQLASSQTTGSDEGVGQQGGSAAAAPTAPGGNVRGSVSAGARQQANLLAVAGAQAAAEAVVQAKGRGGGSQGRMAGAVEQPLEGAEAPAAVAALTGGPTSAGGDCSGGDGGGDGAATGQVQGLTALGQAQLLARSEGRQETGAAAGQAMPLTRRQGMRWPMTVQQGAGA